MKDIPWFEWLYAVTEDGKIWSYPKKTQKSWKFLSICNKEWYSIVFLSANSRKTFYLHRILAECFLPNPENKPHINHKNWIKNDNRINNLEWCTASENMQHAHNMWLFCALSKWLIKWKKIEQYSKDLVFVKEYISIASAWRENKIEKSSIRNCANWIYKTAWGYIWRFV